MILEDHYQDQSGNHILKSNLDQRKNTEAEHMYQEEELLKNLIEEEPEELWLMSLVKLICRKTIRRKNIRKICSLSLKIDEDQN